MTKMKSRIIPWEGGSPFWCSRSDDRKHLEVCRKCPHTEQWVVVEGFPQFEGYELHCKLVRYRDHSGASMASPCIKLKSDCPLEDDLGDNPVLRCMAHPDIACNNRTASGDCSAPKLHCVYALEVKV